MYITLYRFVELFFASQNALHLFVVSLACICGLTTTAINSELLTFLVSNIIKGNYLNCNKFKMLIAFLDTK